MAEPGATDLERRVAELEWRMEESIVDRATLRTALDDGLKEIRGALGRIEEGVGRINGRVRGTESGVAALGKVCEERGRTCPGVVSASRPQTGAAGSGVFSGLSTRSLLILAALAGIAGLGLGLALRPEVLSVLGAIAKAL